MKKQSTSIALIVVLMAACAPMQHGRSYQESVVGGFDLKEWTVGRQRSDQNQRIVEFVRPGEKIDSWTELFTSQVLRKPTNPGPIDALVARVHADDAKLCPNGFVQNVIAQGFRTETEEASILYESKFTNCPRMQTSMKWRRSYMANPISFVWPTSQRPRRWRPRSETK